MAKILIVDDAAFMRNSLKFILEHFGHQIAGVAKDGNEALQLYPEVKPDVVTLDVLMKGMDGISTLRNIMEMDPQARVIIVTAVGHAESIAKAKKLGARGYIKKPFNQEEIVTEIAKVLALPE